MPSSLEGTGLWRLLVAVAVTSLIACAFADLLYFGTSTISADEDRFLASAAHLWATGEFRVGTNVAWEMPGTASFFAPLVGLFPRGGH